MREFLMAVVVVFVCGVLLITAQPTPPKEVAAPQIDGLRDCRAFEYRKDFMTYSVLRCPHSHTTVTVEQRVGKVSHQSKTVTNGDYDETE